MWWVLRKEGDTVRFWGLEITKTSRGFEVRNSTGLVESLLKFLWVRKIEADWKSRRTLYSDGARVSNSLGGSTILPTYAQGWKSHLHGTMQSSRVSRHSKAVHTSAHSHNREQTRSEEVASTSQKYTQHLSSSRTTHASSKRNDRACGRSDSDWAGDSLTRHSVTGYPGNDV